ncbi:MAG: glycosyltransferase family 4 protein [Candidatus Aenigmatarchaeota archaeon]
MRILMATWEFPPFKVGGIGSHCYDLSRTLASMGHDVHVLTYGDKNQEEKTKGVTVHRLPSTNAPDTISWSMFLSHQMEKKAIELHKEEKFDLVHAHDWMTVPAGVGIKKLLKIPMVFTLHSTERGRSGIHNSYTKMINDLEWYGTYEAHEVITVGKDFYNEVKSIFNVPENKIHYIKNGVDISRFDNNKKDIDRNLFAAEWEKLILFVGRLTYQKGVDYLLGAIPGVLNQHPEAKFVIAGGGAVDYYRNMAYRIGIAHKTYFTGYLPEETLISLFKTADITVAPSVYEPFGIVALESAAARTPTVGSYTGGLKETIIHESTGLHSYPAHIQSLCDQINRTLWDDDWIKWMGSNARKMVEKDYTWDKIARWTTGVYGKAMGLWD